MRQTLDKVEIRESVVFENAGQQIFGILHRPAKVKNPPVVVIMHGFASSKHGSNRCYVTLAEYLVKHNIAAFRFDFRGSGDSEGCLSEISLEDLISDGVIAIEKLADVEGIDTKRIGLFGASLGGAIAILAAQRTQKTKALALWAPVASGEVWYRDFLKMHPEYTNVDPGKIFSSYRGVKINPDFRAQFAIMSADKILQELHAIPTLHMHGEKDDVISINHQEAYQKSCAQRGDNLRFLKYPDGEHSLGLSESFPEALTECVQWFSKHL